MQDMGTRDAWRHRLSVTVILLTLKHMYIFPQLKYIDILLEEP